MREIAPAFLAAALPMMAAAGITSAVAAQTQQQIDWCVNKNNAYSPDLSIDGCTAVIQSGRRSGQGLAWAYYNRGNAYQAKGEYDRAIADYTQAIQLDPKDALAYYNNRGLAYRAKGEYDRAIADYTQAIQLDPKYALAYNSRGYAYHAKGEYGRAIADYNQAIQLDPKYALAYNNRGLAYHAKGEYDRAIADYSEAIKIDPLPKSDAHINVYYNRGNAYQAKGEHDRAIADYNQAIQLDPKDALANNNRGLAYQAKGEYDRAIADYNQAIQLDPKYALAYNNRGLAYRAKGDNDRAIADYTQAIQLDPKYALAYFNRGRINLFAGALPKALVDFNQASELNPKYAYAAIWLDIVNKRSNLPSRLSEASKQIDMTKWPVPVIRLYLGQFTPEAALAAADDTNPGTKKGQVCEVNFYSGELALQRSDKDEAARLFELAAADCPKGFIEYDGAVAELKALGATP